MLHLVNPSSGAVKEHGRRNADDLPLCMFTTGVWQHVCGRANTTRDKGGHVSSRIKGKLVLRDVLETE